MCKFTNRLFGLLLLQLLISLTLARPSKMRTNAADLIEFLYNDYGDYGYQVEETHYDQRQKGEENLKVRLDGFLIGLPAQDELSWLDLLADEYLTNVLPKKSVSSETESSLADTTTAQVITIPEDKKYLESRQQINDEVAASPRTKAHILQLLQMLLRTQA